MKHRFLASLLVATALALGACTNPPLGPDGQPVAVSPVQKSLNALDTSYRSLEAAIDAAEVARVGNVLKGQDARNAAAAFTQAKAGLDAARLSLKAALAAPAASAPK
jgi:hypothetical protein